MSITAVMLVVASALCHALWNLISKQQTPSLPFFGLVSVFATFSLTPYALAQGDNTLYVLITYPLEILATGACQALYFAGLARAYRHGNFSVVYPIARALPVILTPVAAFLMFNQTLTLLQAICAVAVLGGCLAISWPRNIDDRSNLNASFTSVALAAIGTTGYTLIDQFVLHDLSESLTSVTQASTGTHTIHSGTSDADAIDINTQWSLIYIWCLSASSLLAILLLTVWSNHTRTQWLFTLTEQKRAALSTAAIMTLTYSLVLVAIHMTTNVSYLVALRQLSIVFGVILGVTFFKERFGKLRMTGLSIMVAGGYMMIPIN